MPCGSERSPATKIRWGSTSSSRLAHDGHVRGADRILPDLAGLVEREVEEPGRACLEAQRFDRAHRFRLADHPLEVEHLVAVHLPRALGREEVLDPPAQFRRVLARDPSLGAEPAQPVEIPADVVVEDRDVAAGHVGDRDLVPVEDAASGGCPPSRSRHRRGAAKSRSPAGRGRAWSGRGCGRPGR